MVKGYDDTEVLTLLLLEIMNTELNLYLYKERKMQGLFIFTLHLAGGLVLRGCLPCAVGRPMQGSVPLPSSMHEDLARVLDLPYLERSEE